MKEPSKATDVLFRAGLILKGVDSLFEVIGGLLLAFPAKLARYMLVLSQHEAFRHHMALSGKLDHLADLVQGKSSIGEAVYLIVHGAAKVVLIAAVFWGKKWGYLGLIIVLSFFACVELFRAIAAREIVTGVLCLLDVVIVVLITKEYRAKFLPGASGSGEASSNSVEAPSPSPNPFPIEDDREGE